MSDSLTDLNRALFVVLTVLLALTLARSALAQVPPRQMYGEALRRQAQDGDWFGMFDEGRTSTCCDKLSDCQDVHGMRATDPLLYQRYAEVVYESLETRGILTAAHLAYLAGYLDQQSRLCPVSVSGWNYITDKKTGERVRLKCTVEHPDPRCDYGISQQNLHWQLDRVRRVTGCTTPKSCVKDLMDPYKAILVAIDHLEAQTRHCHTMPIVRGKFRRHRLRACRRFMRSRKPLVCRKRMERKKCGKPELETSEGMVYSPEQYECRERWKCPLSCKCLITERCTGGVMSTNGNPTSLCRRIERHKEIMKALRSASATSVVPPTDSPSEGPPPALPASLKEILHSEQPESISPSP